MTLAIVAKLAQLIDELLICRNYFLKLMKNLKEIINYATLREIGDYEFDVHQSALKLFALPR